MTIGKRPVHLRDVEAGGYGVTICGRRISYGMKWTRHVREATCRRCIKTHDRETGYSDREENDPPAQAAAFTLQRELFSAFMRGGTMRNA